MSSRYILFISHDQPCKFLYSETDLIKFEQVLSNIQWPYDNESPNIEKQFNNKCSIEENFPNEYWHFQHECTYNKILRQINEERATYRNAIVNVHSEEKKKTQKLLEKQKQHTYKRTRSIFE